MFAAAPLVAFAGGWPTIFSWSIACFGALLTTLCGAPGLLTTLLIGAANLTAAGLEAGSLSPGVDPAPSIAAFAAVMCAAAGSAVRGHSRYWAELVGRTKDAEAGRSAAVSRGIAEERLRIARDLHDSVGHQIAVVNMHIGAAEVHLPATADAARADLSAARHGVQAVLLETQQILRVLRADGDEPGQDLPEYARVRGLVDHFRQAGLTIEARIDDPPDVLPTDTGTAVYRIVQEMLTNAARYSDGAIALTVTATERNVLIEATNLRRLGADQLGTGGGIVGMRERASSVGGILDVTQDNRLFSIRAELPIGDPS
jgi:signal transduction histidine kinase